MLISILLDKFFIVFDFNLEDMFCGIIWYYWLWIIFDGFNNLIFILFIVVCGQEDGFVLGLIVVVYGNELNGIFVIQCFFIEIDLQEFCGIIVGVLVVNVFFFMCKMCCFNDGVDINYIMFGKVDGNVSQVYVY